ncbi:type II toxin-antitoxin system mRNA interferase toxin, RelE/StbE family [Candidatus Wolfebacteria bacterium CG18_big_fil_WC_8_21_14_2_50_39_7]|uniref:Type II toxin-antitoxin system mRNA interferase toxin, RelE/StbE family n=3 Tax=Candidatus Wolfeibacteriota TaxID=1752735 RepID=A0A2M7Q6D4_9BACT|nr:type II toxin-antitoxin system RelE/ParE family toxin [Candidatus Falkowbacteria bacterium]NCO15567.1 type II toxin-antitoxin system RelE/ParE family toxin [Parcubacteria group bacterium]NCQ02584.1 type II toxin-antitoxin system RelE/ParE family toxin [Candidatus Wolfebacteria bacterium]OIO65732.1 MAG: hypothetical protein AUJ30_00580 [Candidatus Wolfebacteria bacterium CG1_02_39_135]PIP92217.1 MAG: type II toxin-antitoxin system mRNA interferase toxin, RelE/StbE family [Candidatus Wolfebact
MKRWLLEFTLDAERDLAKLDCEIRRRIIDKLDWLLENFEAIFPSVLSGEFREFYKLRVGDWRVIYKINWEERIIIVCCVDRRDKIYKKRK